MYRRSTINGLSTSLLTLTLITALFPHHETEAGTCNVSLVASTRYNLLRAPNSSHAIKRALRVAMVTSSPRSHWKAATRVLGRFKAHMWNRKLNLRLRRRGCGSREVLMEALILKMLSLTRTPWKPPETVSVGREFCAFSSMCSALRVDWSL